VANQSEHQEKHLSALTGRPRKLSDGVMIAITEAFRRNAKVSDLAETYGVSEHTIYSICYWTPREKDLDA
jgi:transposase-like protein